MATTKAYTMQLLRHEALALTVGIVLAWPILTAIAPHGAPSPFVILICLSVQALCESGSAMYSQVLQVDGRFGRSALQSCLNGALSIIVILVFAPYVGILAWPIGMVVDSLWQAVFLHLSVRSSGRKVTVPRVTRRHLIVAVGPSLTLFGLTIVYSMTDRIAGLAAGAGTLALWVWALRMGNTGTGLISQPIATVVFSRGHSRGDREPALYGVALCASVSLAVLAVAGYQLVGPEVVRLLFGGGRVSARDVGHLVTLTRLAILAGIPLSVFTVTSRACAARGRFRPTIVAFAAGAICYPALIAIFFGGLSFRSLGVAYALASAVTAVISLATVQRQGWIKLPSKRVSAQEQSVR
jgi:peptidoglycan biosynthesis protein MviN/MurJ (putative lipid II flippase)